MSWRMCLLTILMLPTLSLGTPVLRDDIQAEFNRVVAELDGGGARPRPHAITLIYPVEDSQLHNFELLFWEGRKGVDLTSSVVRTRRRVSLDYVRLERICYLLRDHYHADEVRLPAGGGTLKTVVFHPYRG